MRFFARVLGKMRCYKVPVAVCETFAHDFSVHFRTVSCSRDCRAISINLDTMGVNLSFSLSLSLSLCLCERRHAWEAARTSRSRVNEPLNRECNPVMLCMQIYAARSKERRIFSRSLRRNCANRNNGVEVSLNVYVAIGVCESYS